MLTARARSLEAALVGAAREVNAAATRGLGDQEIVAFMRTVSRIIANLEDGRPA
jgi:hypothetical protein